MNKKMPAQRAESPAADIAKHCGFTAILSFFLTAVFMGVLALLITNINTPPSFHQPATMLAAVLGTLIASRFTAKRRQKDGLLLGAASGFVVFLIVIVISLIGKNLSISAQFFVKLVAFVCAGGLGGIMGVNAASRPKKHRRA